MTARFALPGEPPGPDEPGECNRNPDNEYAWECEWTSPELDKKTAESVIFEVIDPPEPACGPIEINRGEGGPFFCDSTP